MNRLILALVLLGVYAPLVSAQEPKAQRRVEEVTISPGSVTPTPEMWFYEQERRRAEDPKLTVRRKAEQASTQRRQRIASRQWFGYSNTRPFANSTPITGSYSPAWGGNTSNPFDWRGTSHSASRQGFYGLW